MSDWNFSQKVCADLTIPLFYTSVMTTLLRRFVLLFALHSCAENGSGD